MASQTPGAQRTVWTVGHSNHALERFLALLVQHQITLLADVRSTPYSQYASQFNREALASPLRAGGVEYRFLGDLLGGRAQGGQFYDEQGRVLYDRVAQSPGFRQGIERLLAGLATGRAALMCGEEDPTECHRRRLIGRVLREQGVRVLHIRGDGRVQSEEEIAREADFRKTKGQLSLFSTAELG
jgi:uncharacterized protein (DUF488 family)